jgi:hypothetical protein
MGERIDEQGRAREHRIGAALAAHEAPAMARRPDGQRVANLFIVTLTRISAGELDFVNLCGALKAVQDEVADWLGLDDRDRRVRWHFLQQQCERGKWATRIEVEDLKDADETIRKVVGASPRVLGVASEGSLRGRPRRGEVQAIRPDQRGRAFYGGEEGGGGDRRERSDREDRALVRGASAVEQQRLTFMRCYALLPWDQDGGEPVVTDLPQLDGEQPPPTLTVRAPRHTKTIAELQGGARSLQLVTEGSRVTLFRHRWRHEDLGDCWLYTTDRPEADARAQQQQETKAR